MEWECLDRLVTAVQSGSLMFFEEDTEVLDLRKIADKLGDWKHLRLQRFEDRLQVSANLFDADADCDTLVFDREWKLMAFVPIELKRFERQLKKIWTTNCGKWNAVNTNHYLAVEKQIRSFEFKDLEEKVRLMRPNWNLEKLK